MGIVVSELLFRDAVAGCWVFSWLRAIVSRQVNIVVRHHSSLVVVQSGEISKPRGSFPDDDIEDECAYGRDTGRLSARCSGWGRLDS